MPRHNSVRNGRWSDSPLERGSRRCVASQTAPTGGFSAQPVMSGSDAYIRMEFERAVWQSGASSQRRPSCASEPVGRVLRRRLSGGKLQVLFLLHRPHADARQPPPRSKRPTAARPRLARRWNREIRRRWSASQARIARTSAKKIRELTETKKYRKERLSPAASSSRRSHPR